MCLRRYHRRGPLLGQVQSQLCSQRALPRRNRRLSPRQHRRTCRPQSLLHSLLRNQHCYRRRSHPWRRLSDKQRLFPPMCLLQCHLRDPLHNPPRCLLHLRLIRRHPNQRHDRHLHRYTCQLHCQRHSLLHRRRFRHTHCPLSVLRHFPLPNLRRHRQAVRRLRRPLCRCRCPRCCPRRSPLHIRRRNLLSSLRLNPRTYRAQCPRRCLLSNPFQLRRQRLRGSPRHSLHLSPPICLVRSLQLCPLSCPLRSQPQSLRRSLHTCRRLSPPLTLARLSTSSALKPCKATTRSPRTSRETLQAVSTNENGVLLFISPREGLFGSFD